MPGSERQTEQDITAARMVKSDGIVHKLKPRHT